MSGRLFDPGPPAGGDLPAFAEPTLSAERRRTLRRRRWLEAGKHPAFRGSDIGLRKPVGERTCRDCVACVANRRAKTYWKCEKAGITGGPATDIRVSWPACVFFEDRSGSPESDPGG